MQSAIPRAFDARLLFVPVSGPRGMGEYARSLAIASASAARWPNANIHFALSEAAPYAAATPFPKTLLPSSPTFHTQEMVQLILEFRPTIVVFDNAGRTAQLRAAARAGARLVFISSRPRQRRRAFRMHWMQFLDEHWIAWPQFMAGKPGFVEVLKMRVMRRPVLRFLDTILPGDDAKLSETVLARYRLRPGEYVLVVPGGGTDHRGAEDAPQIVAAAATAIALRGHPTILVGVSPVNGTDSTPALRTAARMPMPELAALIRNARLVISNGGDTLLQAISCQRPCVAVAIAGDQAHRIEHCARKGLAVRAALSTNDLVLQASLLLDDDARRQALSLRLTHSGIVNGMETALSALGALANLPQESPRSTPPS